MELLSRRSFVASSLLATLSLEACRKLPKVAHRVDLAVDAVRTFVGDGGLPGIVVVSGDGRSSPEFRTIGTIAPGSSAPMRDDTLFRLYCMTKPITGLAVQRMIAEGRLALDEPVISHLPELAHLDVISAAGSGPAHRGLTIRDLLTHTGGITQPGLSVNAAVPAYLKHGLIEPRISIKSVAAMRGPAPASMEAFVTAMGDVPLLFQPGTAFAYGLSYDLLGAVLERISGKPLDVHLRESVLDPLGMHDTMFVVRGADVGRLAAEMAASPKGMIVNEPVGRSVYMETPSYFEGGNGLVSSPRDYAKFMDAVIMPGKAPAVLRDAFRRLSADIMPKDVHYVDKGLICGMAAGGAVAHSALRRRVKPGTYYWSGVGGTYYWVDFASGYWMLLMTQVVPASALRMKDAITDVLYV